MLIHTFIGLASGIFNKPLGATFTDNPIPAKFVDLFHSNQETQNCTMAELFLKQQERQIESVMGDGNCLFRAISFAIHQDQHLHEKVRKDIVEMMSNNKHKFRPYITGPQPIDTHIKNMSKLGTWGTQAELIAAATLYVTEHEKTGLMCT